MRFYLIIADHYERYLADRLSFLTYEFRHFFLLFLNFIYYIYYIYIIIFNGKF